MDHSAQCSHGRIVVETFDLLEEQEFTQGSTTDLGTLSLFFDVANSPSGFIRIIHPPNGGALQNGSSPDETTPFLMMKLTKSGAAQPLPQLLFPSQVVALGFDYRFYSETSYSSSVKVDISDKTHTLAATATTTFVGWSLTSSTVGGITFRTGGSSAFGVNNLVMVTCESQSSAQVAHINTLLQTDYSAQCPYGTVASTFDFNDLPAQDLVEGSTYDWDSMGFFYEVSGDPTGFIKIVHPPSGGNLQNLSSPDETTPFLFQKLTKDGTRQPLPKLLFPASVVAVGFDYRFAGGDAFDSNALVDIDGSTYTLTMTTTASWTSFSLASGVAGVNAITLRSSGGTSAFGIDNIYTISCAAKRVWNGGQNSVLNADYSVVCPAGTTVVTESFNTATAQSVAVGSSVGIGSMTISHEQVGTTSSAVSIDDGLSGRAASAQPESDRFLYVELSRTDDDNMAYAHVDFPATVYGLGFNFRHATGGSRAAVEINGKGYTLWKNTATVYNGFIIPAGATSVSFYQDQTSTSYMGLDSIVMITCA